MSNSLPSDNPLDPSTHVTLTHLLFLLDRFHHRNRNQHRRSLWYRHFAAFRRQLRHQLADCALGPPPPVPSSSTANHPATKPTHLARARWKSRATQRATRSAARRTQWSTGLVARWYRAFGQLVADARFAALGLVLVAALAEACRALGVTAEMETRGQAEMEAVLKKFAAENWGPEAREGSGEGDRKGRRGEDEGEVVARSAPEEGEDEEWRVGSKGRVGEDGDGLVGRGMEEVVVTDEAKKRDRKGKKKRKKGNAIDDLFNGLD